MVMDNMSLDILSEGQENFRRALGLALFDGDRYRCASHYAVVPPDKERVPASSNSVGVVGRTAPTLVLFWSEPPTFAPAQPQSFLVSDFDTVAGLCWKWLEDNKATLERAWTVGDVWNRFGWRLWTDSWGHLEESVYALAAIRPYAAWIGK